MKKNYPTENIKKLDNGCYELEDYITLYIVEYETPDFIDSIGDIEVSVRDEGYDSTWLTID